MYEILEKEVMSETVKLMKIKAPLVVKKPSQVNLLPLGLMRMEKGE